jgi:hypothetical protein
MIKSIWRPFIFFIITLNIIIWLSAFLFPHIYGKTWPITLSILVLLNFFSFLIFQKSLKQNPKTSAMIFLALTVGKMLLGMIYILVLVMGFGIDSLNDSLFFVILYLAFLVLEIAVFTKNVSKAK